MANSNAAKKAIKSAKNSPEPLPPQKAKPKHPKPGFTATETAASQQSAPTFFWKDIETNGYLCQWYKGSFVDPEIPGRTFNCAEQYMMYRKAMLFNDPAAADAIMAATNPRKQKALAREVEHFNDETWCRERSAIVVQGNWLKFSQCTNVASLRIGDAGEPVPLKTLLLATKDSELAEASPFDRIWGIGFKEDEALAVSRSRWGENLLGKQTESG